jgi:hypothetical protein
MTSWCKLRNDIVRHPKVAQAVRIAGNNDPFLLWVALLAVHAEYGAGGVIPANCATADAAAYVMPAIRWGQGAFDRALAALQEAGLLDVGTNGELTLCGYGPEDMPRCVRCKGPNPDQKHSTCPTCRDTKRAAREPQSAERPRILNREKGDGRDRAERGQKAGRRQGREKAETSFCPRQSKGSTDWTDWTGQDRSTEPSLRGRGGREGDPLTLRSEAEPEPDQILRPIDLAGLAADIARGRHVG